MDNLKTIRDIIRISYTLFSKYNLYYGHGTNTPLEEAILLVSSIVNIPLKMKFKILNCNLTKKEIYHIFNIIKYRINKNIPLVYLTNNIWYYGYQFYIDRRVIIPRSPLGYFIINNLSKLLSIYPKYILDLGTGSGCLGIISSYIFPKAHVDITDISINALEVAEININFHNKTNKIIPIYSDLFKNLLINVYDLIIINPPYISSNDILYFPKEYSYEPKIALIGKYKDNDNGLKIIINIFKNSYKYLTKKGILICEIGTLNNYKNLIKKIPNIQINSKCIILNNNINITIILILNKKQLYNISKEI